MRPFGSGAISPEFQIQARENPTRGASQIPWIDRSCPVHIVNPLHVLLLLLSAQRFKQVRCHLGITLECSLRTAGTL